MSSTSDSSPIIAGSKPIDEKAKPRSSSRDSFLVAAGILLSRIAGLVRERVFAHYFGNSDAGDAFRAGLKIPNFLQNLLGEGVLSASFIPTYSNLLARGDKAEAGRVAGVIASILFLITSLLVLIGVISTPYLIDLVAPGFTGEKRLLTIKLVQIFFPGTGLSVLSAWCLGILNSHRRFFLSYVAPVIWNVAQIATLIIFGGSRTQTDLSVLVAWGLVAGSALQFGVQLPVALRLIDKFRPGLDLKMAAVRTIAGSFLPVVVARGVVQISGYIDGIFASLLSTGAVSAIGYAQVIYMLPVSLFGMSVSAAELPAMSSQVGSDEEVAAALRKKLDSGLKQIAFFIVPSAMAFLALGDVVTATLYQGGKFDRNASIYVWSVLIGSGISLLAITMGRLYSAAFYALKDTRTPLKFAIARVALNILLGYIFALKLPLWLHLDIKWGAAGLTVASGIAGWLEFSLLRNGLNKRIGQTGLPLMHGLKLWLAALIAAALAWGVKLLIGSHHPLIVGALVLGTYGMAYFALTWLLGIPEVRSLTRRFERFLPKRR